MSLLQLDGPTLAQRVSDALPDSVVPAFAPPLSDSGLKNFQDFYQETLWVKAPCIADVAAFLQQDEELDFQYLNAISAIDFVGHFELVYHLTSFRKGHKATMRARLEGREDLTAPSVYHLWRGADFQEREIWDLMGIRFEGHPNMKRIMLWEGFEGHPLRKDFLG